MTDPYFRDGPSGRWPLVDEPETSREGRSASPGGVLDGDEAAIRTRTGPEENARRRSHARGARNRHPWLGRGRAPWPRGRVRAHPVTTAVSVNRLSYRWPG